MLAVARATRACRHARAPRPFARSPLAMGVEPPMPRTALLPSKEIADINVPCKKSKYTVLCFYPADFTFVCASELPGFSRAAAQFAARDATVMFVSSDSVHAHKGWRTLDASHGGLGGLDIVFPMLSDGDKKLARSLNMINAKTGLCNRGVVVLCSESGEALFQQKMPDPVGGDADDILRVIDGHIAHTTGAGVCPFGWQKGKKMMEPTLEGVAKYDLKSEVNS